MAWYESEPKPELQWLCGTPIETLLPPSDKKYDVFLSHAWASTGEDVARTLKFHLKELGFDGSRIFLDKDVPGGVETAKLEQYVEEASAMVILLTGSKETGESDYFTTNCLREVCRSRRLLHSACRWCSYTISTTGTA